MKKIILILSICLCVLLGVFIVIYINTNNVEDTNIQDVQEEEYEPLVEIEVKQDINEANKSITDVISSDNNLIVYTDTYTSDNLNISEQFSDVAQSNLSQDDLMCISTLLSQWVDTLDDSTAEVILISDNFGQGYAEIILNVQCGSNTAELHVSYDMEENHSIGYLKDTTDKE